MKRWMIPASLLLLPSLVAGQSLAEAARREKERRERNREAGVEARVVTEEDLKNAPGTLANDPDEAPAVVSGAAGARDAKREADTRAQFERRKDQEELWRTRAAQARARVEKARKTHDVLTSLHLAPGEYFMDEQGKVLIRSLDHLRELIGKAKAELEASEKGLEQLEEAARRNNVPPGWLRQP